MPPCLVLPGPEDGDRGPDALGSSLPPGPSPSPGLSAASAPLGKRILPDTQPFTPLNQGSRLAQSSLCGTVSCPKLMFLTKLTVRGLREAEEQSSAPWALGQAEARPLETPSMQVIIPASGQRLLEVRKVATRLDYFPPWRTANRNHLVCVHRLGGRSLVPKQDEARGAHFYIFKLYIKFYLI